MTTLWEQLKPEYKEIIKKQQEKYDFSPQNLEKRLREEVVFSHLTIGELSDLFTWTDTSLTNLEWKDVFGDRFLIKE